MELENGVQQHLGAGRTTGQVDVDRDDVVDALGIFGLVEMLLFVLTVFVAYAYVWRRGGLEWD